MIFLAPYDDHGNLLNEPTPDAAWHQVEPFVATMSYCHTLTSGVVVRDEAGRLYRLYGSDCVHLQLNGHTITAGPVRATWIVIKRGTRYGVRYLGAAPTVPTAPSGGQNI